MPAKSKVYMDSCCFIELALQSAGKHEADRENDLWFLKELLNAASDEAIEVLTSTLSIAECSHAKGDISDDVKSLFKRFLTSGRYVFLVQDSVLVAERARNLRWVHSLAFGGADSVHIASAMELKCDEFLTWDNKPHANATALNDLALPIRFPHDTQCLPGEYRQQKLIAGAAANPMPPAESIESDNHEIKTTLPTSSEISGSDSGPTENQARAETSKGTPCQETEGETMNGENVIDLFGVCEAEKCKRAERRIDREADKVTIRQKTYHRGCEPTPEELQAKDRSSG